MSIADSTHKKAAEKAMNLLLHQDRTIKELERRLHKAGFSPDEVSFAIEYVSSYGYVDDKKYADRYVQTQKCKRSRKEISSKLRDKGVDDDIISEALMSYDVKDEEDAIESAFIKRLKGRHPSELTYDESIKHISYLTRRGYQVSSVKKVLSSLAKSDTL